MLRFDVVPGIEIRPMNAPFRLALAVFFTACGSDAPRFLGDTFSTPPAQDAALVTVDPGDAPSLGPASARVVVIEFGDFECPSCVYEEPIVSQMLSDYAGQIRFVFKEFPLTDSHPHAEMAAEAALAANAQGKFWPFHDVLFANPSALGRPDLDGYASMLRLDMATFDRALDQGSFKNAVAADLAQGESVGVNGTPTLFVNGLEVYGTPSYATLKRVIDKQLATKP